MQTLQDTIDRLAAFEPVGLPVISLYLNMQADERGRDQYEGFLRKELPARAATYVAHSAERESLDRDMERIQAYLRAEVRPSANGLAIFACSGAGDSRRYSSTPRSINTGSTSTISHISSTSPG